MYEEEDFIEEDEPSEAQDQQEEQSCWTCIRSSFFDLYVKQAIYNGKVDVSLRDVSVVENKDYNRQMIFLPQTTLIENYVWSRNSPTVDDCYMDTIISMSENSKPHQMPIILYDPKYINALTKFFKNMANGELTKLTVYVQKLFDQKVQEIKLKKEKQGLNTRKRMNMRNFTKQFSDKLSNDDENRAGNIRSVDSALSSPGNGINQKYMTPQFKTSFGGGGGAVGGGAQTHKSTHPDDKGYQIKVDCGSRENKTIQIGGLNIYGKDDRNDRGWSSSGSDLDVDTPDLDSKSDDTKKRKQKSSEDKMEKQIAKHQNCKIVHQLQMRTKVVGRRGVQIVCLHHQVQLAPFFEIKAKTFELIYDTQLDHSILDVRMGIGQDGFNDLTQWPLTEFYRESSAPSKETFKCEDFVKDLRRHCMIYPLNQSDNSEFRIKTIMYTDTCPLLIDDPNKSKKPTGCEFFLNDVNLKFYQEMFLRVLNYFINRFLWAVTDADPYIDY